MSTLHWVLENGVDLYVNERQKIRQYRVRSTEERRRKKNAKSRFFYIARCVRKIALYSERCYTLIRLEISRRTRRWCLKCVIVYLARDIPAFVNVMYCVYGASRLSLLIVSTNSMITILLTIGITVIQTNKYFAPNIPWPIDIIL